MHKKGGHRSGGSDRPKVTVYERVTERITQLLEQGTVPWQKPWNAHVGRPRNGVSGKYYRGLNVFMLSHAGYESPWWFTPLQVDALGGHILKGGARQLGSFLQALDSEGRPGRSAGSRNRRGGDFLPPPGADHPGLSSRQPGPVRRPRHRHIPRKASPGPRTCAKRQRGHRRVRRHRCRHAPAPGHSARGRPGAVPAVDGHRPHAEARHVQVFRVLLRDVLFHELTHSTGHADRLNRKTLTDGTPFGSLLPTRREELCAEMGAAFLCATAGIDDPTVQNTASYIRPLADVSQVRPEGSGHRRRPGAESERLHPWLGRRRTGRG